MRESTLRELTPTSRVRTNANKIPQCHIHTRYDTLKDVDIFLGAGVFNYYYNIIIIYTNKKTELTFDDILFDNTI